MSAPSDPKILGPKPRRRGFIIPIILMLIPVIVLTVFTLVQLSINENGFSLHSATHQKLFYMSESGLNLAWYAFAASSFAQTTHGSDGVTPAPANSLLQMSSAQLDPAFGPFLPRTTAPDMGWFEWQSPGDTPTDSFTDSGVPETIRFQVYYPTPGHCRLVCKALLGSQTTTHTVDGVTYSPFQYVWFANGDWDLCPGGSNLSLTGQLQVNGDLYLTPHPGTNPDPTVALTGELMAASGRIIRYVNIDGTPDAGGEVTFAHLVPPDAAGAPQLLPGVADGVSGQGNEYDSFNPNWPSQGPNGAIQRFGGGLIDGSLGGQSVQPPSQSMAPGGYYDSQAGLHITSATSAPWASSVQFLNFGENVTVQAVSVDVSQLTSATGWPANGIIYSNVPLVLNNAETLPYPLTIVSDCGIYVHGGYNRDLPAGSGSHQPAALMTTDRITLLSDAWSPATQSLSTPAQMTRSLYNGDPNPVNQILEVNAALVDGSPPESGARFVASWAGVVNPFYGTGGLAGATDEDFFNEGDLSALTVKVTGSYDHLENATMALFDNANVANGITGWFTTAKAYGNPPVRQYIWDPALATAKVPGVPLVGLRLLWQTGP